MHQETLKKTKAAIRTTLPAFTTSLLLGLGAGAQAFPIDASVSATVDRSHTTRTALDVTNVNGETSFLQTPLTGYAGRLQTRITSGANATTDAFLGDATDQSIAWTWCIEPQDYVNSSDTYDVSALAASSYRQFGSSAGDQRKADVAALFGSLIDLGTGRVKTTVDDDSLGLSDRDRMTAFQLALWEIAQETDLPASGAASNSAYDLTSGAFTLVSVRGVSNGADIRAQANQWLAGLGTTLQARDDLEFWVLDTTDSGTAGGQSQIALSVVPLPAGILLFASGLVLLLGYGRRQRAS